MAKIHIFLQGKGGVGKSFSCAMLAQYLIASREKTPICIDTDPINATFAAFPAFNAQRVEVMEGDKVNARKFDEIIMRIDEAQEDDVVVIDNGASSFIPFSSYLLSAGIPDMLIEMGHYIYANTIITGGDAMDETIRGFAAISKQFPESTMVNVWINPYFGTVIHNGKKFEELSAYKQYKHRINAIVTLPELQAETFGYDLSKMLKEKLTFDEVLSQNKYDIMSRQRLKMIQREIFSQLDAIPYL